MGLALALVEDNLEHAVDDQYMIVGVHENCRAHAQFKLSFNENGMSNIEVVNEQQLPVDELTLTARVLKTIADSFYDDSELYTDIFYDDSLNTKDLPLLEL